MKTVLLTIAIVLVCVLIMSFRVLFVKGGRFPDSHVGHSKALRSKGIGCASDSRNN